MMMNSHQRPSTDKKLSAVSLSSKQQDIFVSNKVNSTNYKIPEITDDWYKTIIQSAMEGFVLGALPGNILDVNDAFCRMLGYSREELLTMTAADFDIRYKGNQQRVTQGLQRAKETGGRRFETHHRRKDGKIIDVMVSIKTMDIGPGFFFCFHRDVTEEKMIFKQLKESEERYRALIELGGNIGEAVVMLQDIGGRKGTQVFVSDKWCHLTGYSKSDLHSMSFFDLLQPRYRLDFSEIHYNKMKSDSSSSHSEMSIIRSDGTELPIGITSAITIYQGKAANVVYIRDITERKNMEEQLRLFSRKIIGAQEAERMRIARELHDQMAQDLVAIRIEAASLMEQDVKHSENAPAADAEAGRLLALIDNAINNVQSTSASLRPQILDTLGLLKAVQSYAEDFEHRSGISCQFNIKGHHTIEESISKESSILIYRIVQEALLNVLRHSKATKVDINVNIAKDSLKISVADNGCGMDIGKTKEVSSLGILGMHERASLAGGTLLIRSKPGKGTRITVTLPLPGIMTDTSTTGG